MRISADSHVFAAGMRCYSTQALLRLHEKCISLAQILSGSCLGEGLLFERERNVGEVFTKAMPSVGKGWKEFCSL